jgi:hypothetical protein
MPRFDPLTVSAEQREALEPLLRTHSTPQRARMIRHAANGVGGPGHVSCLANLPRSELRPSCRRANESSNSAQTY